MSQERDSGDDLSDSILLSLLGLSSSGGMPEMGGEGYVTDGGSYGSMLPVKYENKLLEFMGADDERAKALQEEIKRDFPKNYDEVLMNILDGDRRGLRGERK